MLVAEWQTGRLEVNKGVILVADDEEMICNLVNKALTKEGYLVELFSNGREVLERLQSSGDIDLIIMDINMPEMDGLQALALIRQLGLQLPVIIVTGKGCNQSLAKAQRLNVFAYLTKPFELSELKRLAAEALTIT